MKIALVANTGWYLLNFRKNLGEFLIDSGVTVHAVCPADRFVPELQQLGWTWNEWQLNRSGMNPLREYKAVQQLARIYRTIQPDLAHHFTMKAVLYGTLAANKAKVPRIVNSITGLGHLFISQGIQVRLTRLLLQRWIRTVLSAPNAECLLQNQDDLGALSKFIPRLAQRAILTNGSGVDLKRFQPRPESKVLQEQETILFAGRLIKEKGIYEFVELARRLKNPNRRFLVCGEPDPGNLSSVTPEMLEGWKQENIIDFLGHTEDMPAQLGQADIVVLPSYREGMPRVLLEASAMAKPIVATDVPGCRDVVKHQDTGLLVEPGNSLQLTEAVEYLLANPQVRLEMGQRGRQYMEQAFDDRTVLEQTLQAYNRLFQQDFFSLFSNAPVKNTCL